MLVYHIKIDHLDRLQGQDRRTNLYLTSANIFPQVVACHGHSQVRMVLPRVSVGRIFPAARARRKLDTWQQNPQPNGDFQLSGGWIASSCSPESEAESLKTIFPMGDEGFKK